jgi:cytidylate kinase
MSSIYPIGVGYKIPLAKFDFISLVHLKKNLPPRTIFRIYGMAQVGKGTNASLLSDVLDIPNLDSGMILRSITFICLENNWEPLDENMVKAYELLKVKILPKETKLRCYYNDLELTATELRSHNVNKNLTHFTGKSATRELYYQTLGFILINCIEGACVLDGRGIDTPYLKIAKDSGMNIIKILVDCDYDVRCERIVAAEIEKNPNLSDLEIEQIKLNFVEGVVKRDENDAKMIKNMGIGLISEDSIILDTTAMNKEQAFESLLACINSRLLK